MQSEASTAPTVFISPVCLWSHMEPRHSREMKLVGVTDYLPLVCLAIVREKETKGIS